MGVWLTYEARLEYHREYNTRYRKANPNKVRAYHKSGAEQAIKSKLRKDAHAAMQHRLEVLVDEQEEGQMF